MLGQLTFRNWIGCLTVLAMVCAAAAQQTTADTGGKAELAWRLDGLSSSILGPNRPDAVYRQSAALLDEAGKLNPQEPRFPRLRTLALSHLGDTDAAIESLKAYRALKPGDTVAQVQLIDLYASQMQTLDAKLQYVTALVNNEKLNLPPEVRATLASEAAALLAQKSPKEAAEMATKAVFLYPLPQATREYYQYVASQQDLQKRVAGLVAVLKANPNQPLYSKELATLLAVNGLSNESLRWYEISLSTTIGRPAYYHNLVIDYASQFIVSGKLASAGQAAGQILQLQPLDADAWFLRLTVDRASSQEVFNQSLEAARISFVRRWNAFCDEVNTGHPATEPATLEPIVPDPTAPKIQPADIKPVLAKIKQKGDFQQEEAFVSVVSDIAWFELYFDQNAKEAARWNDALRDLLKPDSVVLQRLEGWQALIAGDTAKAGEILSKTAKSDALSEFGVIRLNEIEKNPIDPARVKKLLDENRIGLVAGMLWAAFRSGDVHPATQPAALAAADELKKFPNAMLLALTPTTASQVYGLHAEPVDTGIPFGDPVLARVSLTNISDFDITIGPDGLLRPDLWFDAGTLGFDRQVFPGVAYDDLHNQIVLRPRASITQIARIDQGKLRQLLRQSPGSNSMVDCSVITNPIPIPDPSTGQETAVPGPGGMQANFYRTFTYSGISLTLPAGKAELQRDLASKNAADRIHAADVIAGFIRLVQNPTADDALRKATADLPGMLATLRRDPAPAVSAWASFLSARLAPEANQQKIAEEMADSPDASTRLLALWAAPTIAIDAQKQIATKLSSDADPAVKSAASATLELLNQPNAHPTTQPVVP